ncbi:UNVERIFIED_CONTAM: hypothetical protein GTU68_038433 [Idotea baltica]|nr:hypothetical protein [Idotea baltica]
MESSSLELLVHGVDIASASVKLTYPGVELQGITQVENPNYLFLDIKIDPKAEAGLVDIQFTKGKEQLLIKYELRSRVKSEQKIQGISSKDFIYLLMPDRFANGDEKNDHVPSMYEGTVDRAGILQRHGGDIQGVIDHLDYLVELGVTAIWMNPVLENNQPKESYHGYAITNHYKIDPRFGTNDLYVEFVEQCHERGIKVVGDIIHNHVGNEHWFIKDLPSKDWIHQFDEFTKTTYRAPTLLDPYAAEYDKNLMSNGWFDHHMPDLNQENRHLATYLIQNNIWWVEHAGIDAYRIDTYAYPDQAFMSKWASALRAEYPSLSLFAETWVHGVPVQSWFTEQIARKSFDNSIPAVTDFQLHYAINDALSQPFGWTEGVARLYYTLAKDYVYSHPEQLVTFLDNHDVSRFYSTINEDFEKYKMGLGFLLTTRGIPQIYYGTEILMPNSSKRTHHDQYREEFSGGWKGDTQNKFTIEGRTAEEQAAFEFVSKLANYRKNTPALTTGKLMQFVPEEGVYVYFRYDDAKTIMVILNQNPKGMKIKTGRFAERLNGFTKAKNVLTNDSISLTDELELPMTSITILELAK